MGQGEVRFLCIARVPTLLYLNGSVVSNKERIEAERRYVNMLAQLLVKRMEPPSTTSKLEGAGNKNGNDVEEQAQERSLSEHPQ